MTIRIVYILMLGTVLLAGGTPQCRAADAAPTQRHQDFSTDPGWEGVGNLADLDQCKTTRQKFGWSPTSHASTTPGEIGGLITRSLEPAWYAKKIDPLTFNDRFSASGTISLVGDEGSTGILVGFFNKNSRGWRTPNSFIFRLDGNGDKAWVLYEYGTQGWLTAGEGTFEGRWQTTKTKPLPADGLPHNWSLAYDPNAADGRGEMFFGFDGREFRLPLSPGHKQDGAVFDRFGIFNQQISGRSIEAYVGDLVINGQPQDLTKDPGWEAIGNRVEFLDCGVRPIHNFGYSADTSNAGGEKGEMGGMIWRTEPGRDKVKIACYADRVGPLTLDRELRASGRFAMTAAGSDSGLLLGWFNSATAIGNPPANFLGVYVEGPSRIGHYFRPLFSAASGDHGIVDKGPIVKPDGNSHEWTLVYAPSENDGLGRITATLDGQQVSYDLKPGQNRANFDRFGAVTFGQGGHHIVFYLDDLSYTAAQ